MQVIRYFILLTVSIFFGSISLAQRQVEVGFGVVASGLAVDPLPAAYRSNFSGPVTYPGYYIEGAVLLFQHEKWKPRALLRFQSEGSNESIDWPQIRLNTAGIGGSIGYQLSPVISVLGGGIANYQLSSKIVPLPTDQPQLEKGNSLSGRINIGVRGDFGRWSSEMIFEKSFTSLSGAVLLSKEGTTSFQPSYSFVNILLGVKYKLFQSAKT